MRGWLFNLGLALGVASSAYAYDPNDIVLRAHDTPRELQGIGITEKTGEGINLDLPFISDTGEQVTLSKYFGGHKPVLLSIVYYNCASLCNYHMNGVTEALKGVNWTPGREFELVAVSMDHREGPDLAGPKKANYVRAYGRPESAEGWHFLTGSEESIKQLADQVGFAFRWDEETKQYAHASAAILITPNGTISRYVHGIAPDAKTMRLALLEASEGKVGTLVDQFVMMCFKFDPKKSKYTLAAWNIMRVGVILMVILVAVIMIPLWIRERRHQGPA